ncbi:MAG: hypothetical protein OK452_02335 [Thaumarchaeota archaeon]|nr:hypothetical protein [Nitrososphaerota archaeon]
MRQRVAMKAGAALIAAIVGLSLVYYAIAPSQPNPRVSLVKSVPIPGVAGRLDHMDIDAASQRVFLAAVQDGSLVVVRLSDGLVTRYGGYYQPHSVLFLSSIGELILTVGNGTVYFLNSNTLVTSSEIRLPSNADNIRLDPRTGFVYVGYGQGPAGGIAQIDPKSSQVVRTLTLGGHPESFQLDVSAGYLYANVPTLGIVDGVRLQDLKVQGNWSTGSYVDNYPMAIDPSGARVYVATWFPSTLLSYSETTGALLTHTPIVGDADDLYFVSNSNVILISGGQGSVEVVSMKGGTSSIVAEVRSASGARTSLFLQDSMELLVAAPATGTRSASLLVFSLAI